MSTLTFLFYTLTIFSIATLAIFGVACVILTAIDSIKSSEKSKKKYAKTKQIQIVNAFATILKIRYGMPEIFESEKSFIVLNSNELEDLVSEMEANINEKTT